MKIIDRYILKSHIGPFFFAFLTMLFVLILQFFSTFAERFIGKGIGFLTMTELILLQSAWMVGFAAPMAALVAAVMAFGSLTNTSEMTIFRASGISLYRLMAPVLLAALLLSAVVERFNNLVQPQANYYAKSMMADIARSKPAFGLTENAFSTLVDGYSIFVRSFDDESKELQGVVIYDSSGKEKTMMASAEKGRLDFIDNGRYLVLTLFNGEMHQVNRLNSASYHKMSFGKHRLVFETSGFGFARSSDDRVRSDDNELSATELLTIGNEFKHRVLAAEERVQVLRRGVAGEQQNASRRAKNEVDVSHVADQQRAQLKGELSGELKTIEDNTAKYNKYMVAYHKKYSLSLACFVFVMVGAPLGVLARRGGFGVGAAMSLLFFVLYWMLMIAGEKLAERGALDPMLAMWLGNMVMMAIGLWLMVSLTRSLFKTSR